MLEVCVCIFQSCKNYRVKRSSADIAKYHVNNSCSFNKIECIAPRAPIKLEFSLSPAKADALSLSLREYDTIAPLNAAGIPYYYCSKLLYPVSLNQLIDPYVCECLSCLRSSHLSARIALATTSFAIRE